MRKRLVFAGGAQASLSLLETPERHTNVPTLDYLATPRALRRLVPAFFLVS